MEHVFCFGGSGGPAPQASYYDKPITQSRFTRVNSSICTETALGLQERARTVKTVMLRKS